VSPFDIRFSQMRARTEFRDGRSVEEALESIKAVRCEQTDGETDGPVWVLKAPFPPIEVLPWRCKLRDEQGKPMLCAETGGELWDADDNIFSLDNRRLYCFQKAAAALWPDRVVIDVVELPPQSLTTSSRQVRKFRTLDCGESILIGERAAPGDDKDLKRWSWREAVGLAPREAVTKDAANVCVQMRRRPRGDSHRGGRRNWDLDSEANVSSDKVESGTSPWSGLVLFAAIYCSLRCFTSMVSAHRESAAGSLTAVDDLPGTAAAAVLAELPAQRVLAGDLDMDSIAAGDGALHGPLESSNGTFLDAWGSWAGLGVRAKFVDTLQSSEKFWLGQLGSR